MAASIFWIFLCLCISQGLQAEEENGTFLVVPKNSEISGLEPIDLVCIYSEPIDYCRWWKNDKIVRSYYDSAVYFVGSAGTGNCTLRIERPEVGKHTARWKCAAITMSGRYRMAPEAWLFVKNYPRIDYYARFIGYEIMYVNVTNSTTSAMSLEVKTDYDTRVRWFVDGQPVPATSYTLTDLINPVYEVLYSTINVTFPKPDAPIRSVYSVVEYRDNFYCKKTVTVFSAPVIAPWFSMKEMEKQNLTYTDDNPKTLPRPMMLLDGKPIPNDQEEVWIESSYPTLHEFRVKCVETNAFPYSVLTWDTYTDESNLVSDYSEFNTTWQALADSEQIDLHGLLRNQVSKATISCDAKNIFRMDNSRVSISKDFKIKIVRPVCKAGQQVRVLHKNSSSSNPLKPKIFIISIAIVFYALSVSFL